MTEKVVVTNLSALRGKYGRGTRVIQRALKRLSAADKRRDIRTQIIALDSKTAMKRLRGRAVTDPIDPEQNKKANRRDVR